MYADMLISRIDMKNERYGALDVQMIHGLFYVFNICLKIVYLNKFR